MKAHILVFDSAQADGKHLRKVIDQFGAIVNWYAFFGNVMCLASDRSASALSKYLREQCPGLRFLITTVDPDEKGGWMPRSIWSFLNDPQSAESETA